MLHTNVYNYVYMYMYIYVHMYMYICIYFLRLSMFRVISKGHNHLLIENMRAFNWNEVLATAYISFNRSINRSQRL